MGRNRTSAKRAGEYLTDSEFIKRFWCKTDRSVGERNCWEWKSANNGHYGFITFQGKSLYAHKVAYELAKGKIPEGCFISHTCGNTLCINPAHLFANHDRKPLNRVELPAGTRFGRLVVLKEVNQCKPPRRQFQCRCDCGRICVVNIHNLRRGSTRSCGCIAREKLSKRTFRHGDSAHCTQPGHKRLYRIWSNMKERCTNPKHKSYPAYGGSGVTVCLEWGEYAQFKLWALSHDYDDSLTIDRIDCRGNYCPENCRWANATVQANNRRNNKILTHEGRSMTESEWSRYFGVAPSSFRSYLARHDMGKTFEHYEMKAGAR